MEGAGLEGSCTAAADLQQQQCWGPSRVRASLHRSAPQQQQQYQQQQQWQKQQLQQQDNSSVVPATSPRADRAYELYSECVRAGQWARVTVEQRRDGEYITLLCRPMAAVATAAAAGAFRRGVRKPNLRRSETFLSGGGTTDQRRSRVVQLTRSCNNSSSSSSMCS